MFYKNLILPAIFAIFMILGPLWAKAAVIEEMPFDRINSSIKQGGCHILIDFASYASGIDYAVFKKVKEYIQGDASISSAREYPWGMEGEKTLCLVIPDGNTAKDVYQHIKGMLPAKAAKGSIGLTMGDLSFHVSE